MSGNLFALLKAHAGDLQKAFLLTGDGRTLSYGETFERAAQTANALVDSGVKVGDRIAAQIDKSIEALILYFACLRAGAVYLPLNLAYTPGEIEYFLSDAEPVVFVCAPERFNTLSPIAKKAGVKTVLTLGADGKGSLTERAAKGGRAFADSVRDKDDLAALLYTSGTTGRPKGAMLTHDNLASNALVLVDFWRFTSKDVLLHALPIFHTHGLFVATNTVMMAGGSMIVLPKFNLNEVFRHLPLATAMMGVPTFYTRLVDDPRLTREATRHMRLFVSGSAPLLAETHRAFEAKTGHKILERYGMTETNMITSNPYDGARVAGAVGPPLPGVSVRIADAETGKILPRGEVGVIEVKGPNVFKGYWRMPEKTKAEFRADGYFITGDVGKIDDEGYVHIVGRSKDLVISGGFNVYPREVEGEIDALPDVVESAVIGVPHPDFGEGVTAVVVAAKAAKIDEAAIIKALEGRLAKFKLPKRVIFVADLPRNAMGKVMKAELRKAYQDLYRTGAPKS
ncbi:MAG: malonyl-CoA synthase [Hyphomicrobiaceae bacterium]|nr:MAG: malonyl-CoA synthase [Hyphomicrobiaceae bacterium]